MTTKCYTSLEDVFEEIELGYLPKEWEVGEAPSTIDPRSPSAAAKPRAADLSGEPLVQQLSPRLELIYRDVLLGGPRRIADKITEGRFFDLLIVVPVLV